MVQFAKLTILYSLMAYATANVITMPNTSVCTIIAVPQRNLQNNTTSNNTKPMNTNCSLRLNVMANR